MKSNAKRVIVGIILSLWTHSSFALQERHLVFIRQGGAAALNKVGKEQIQQTGEVLLTHGFDNRSIVAVYVAPDKGSQACAKQLADMGVFQSAKIIREIRLADKKKAEPILELYDDIEKKHQKGHVIIIDDNTRSMQLITALTHESIEISMNQPYILPFSLRQTSFA